jgi:hypothetical protein
VDATVDKGLDDAVRLIRASPETYQAVARACGITKQAVLMWTRVPLARVLTVSNVLNLPCHLIRPDHYPPPTDRRRRRRKLPHFNEARQAQLAETNHTRE